MSPPDIWVRIEPGPTQITARGVGPSVAYAVGTGDVAHFGAVETREQAWACALSTLRGMIALEKAKH